MAAMICCPETKYHVPGWYLGVCRKAVSILERGGRFYFPDVFSGDEITKMSQWKRLFINALDRRINAKAGLLACRGRKDNHDWQRHAWQLAQRVNTPRLIVRESECPPEFRKRLAHRLTLPGDECW